jgi:ELWxxDGT repeat protein
MMKKVLCSRFSGVMAFVVLILTIATSIGLVPHGGVQAQAFESVFLDSQATTEDELVVIYQLKDIYVGSGSSTPTDLTFAANTLFFIARDNSGDRELWKSDGTEGGTLPFKSFYVNDFSHPLILQEMEGMLYIWAPVLGTGYYGLWKTDGTSAGTTLVKDFSDSEVDLFSLDGFAVMGGNLYFFINDYEQYIQLWKSDGTEAGTTMVLNMDVGGWDPDLDEVISDNSSLYFSITNGDDKNELWKSNGTGAGTEVVKNFAEYLTDLTIFNGKVFFVADDGTAEGEELWSSDGNAMGTALFKDINTGGDSSPSLIGVMGTNLYFFANDGTYGGELWKTDGTSGGTVLVKEILPGAGGDWPGNPMIVGTNLFFSADDGSTGVELWVSDGTLGGTHLVKDISSGGSSSAPYPLLGDDGILYFDADDGANGVELWRSDGTDGGTTRISDIYSGSGSSAPRYMVEYFGRYFFQAVDGNSGEEVWVLEYPDRFKRIYLPLVYH